jgi:hypothetical protein
MAILDEVQLSDSIDVDRGHRLAPPPRRGDPLPSALQSARARAKQPVEFAAPSIDGADDRLQGDRMETEVAFGHSPQGSHHAIEAQHRQPLLASHRQARGELRERLATARAGERRRRV